MPLFLKIGMIALVPVIIIVAVFYYVGNNENAPANENITEKSHETSGAEMKAKIGQMIMVGFRGTEVDDSSYITRVIAEAKVGGVILFDYDIPSKSFPRNIINPAQTKKLIFDLQSRAATPLLVAVDAEGGNVNRLKEKYGFQSILSAKEMGGDGTLKTTKKESVKLTQELKEFGFNMNFAPVVDVDINPKNPVIGGLGRSFSSDFREVVEHAKVFIQSHLENNVIPVEKHFPGHGSSTGDSHVGLVDITGTYQQEELNPYRELQKNGLLDVVMTAHVINKNIDKDYPATLSPLFIQKILRDEVGFEGVVISDDMQMNAIVDYYGFKEAVTRAINAGCDIILLSNNGTAIYDEDLPYKAIDIIYSALQDGSISKERIEESYDRIYHLKKKFGIIRAP